MTKEKFTITGMTCSACSARVEKVTKQLPGVTAAEVNLLAGTLLATYDEARCSAAAVIAAVENAGYGAAPFRENNAVFSEKDPELTAMKRRILLSFCFLIPLMYVSMGHMLGLPLPGFLRLPLPLTLAELALTIPILILNRAYYARGFKNLFHGAPNMDSLIAVGSGAAVLYGLGALIGILSADPKTAEALAHDLYFESAGTILTLVTLGKFFETRSKGQTGQAIRRLMDLSPKTALRLVGGKEEVIPAAQVQKGDLLLLKPGAAVPVDGIVTEGFSALDESTLTGESIPVEKTPGDRVFAATINGSGSLVIRAERVGQDTTLAGIIRLVEEAGSSKAPVSRLADRIAGIFVPTVMAIALAVGLLWLLLGRDFSFSLTRAISVLVISCPCALGLATPVSVMVGTGQGAQWGILIKSAEALELLSRVDTVVLDKTGTLTEGKPRVTELLPEGIPETELLRLAASLEVHSEHPLAAAVTEASGSLPLSPAEDFRAVPGRGVIARIEEKTVAAGNPAFMAELGVKIPDLAELTGQGKTLLYFSADGTYIGAIAAADREKENAAEAVERLRGMGLQVAMLTGDNARTARVIGDRLGVDQIFAQVLPQEKEARIRALQQQGHRVCMVGDGINDAPALAAAEVGVAIGAGTDVAIDSADVVLMRSDPLDICTGIELSRAVLKNIRLSLFWAFFYNLLGIPIAAGALIPLWGLQLSPMVAAAAMSFSSVCVVSNALRLKKFHPTPAKRSAERKKEEINMKTELEIKGMMCPHCQAHVEKALSEVEGVTAVAVDLQGGRATVEGGDPAKLTAAVAAAGYECRAL